MTVNTGFETEIYSLSLMGLRIDIVTSNVGLKRLLSNSISYVSLITPLTLKGSSFIFRVPLCAALKGKYQLKIYKKVFTESCKHQFQVSF